MKGKLIVAFLLGICCCQSAPLWAADTYVKASTNYLWVRTEDVRFSPLALELAGGWYLQKQLALEFQASTGVKDSERVNIATALDYQLGLSLRFETPEVEGGQLYLLGGYGLTALDVDRNHSGRPGSLDYKGGTFGLGLQIRPEPSARYTVFLQGQRFFAKSGVSIDQLQLGVAYAF